MRTLSYPILLFRSNLSMPPKRLQRQLSSRSNSKSNSEGEGDKLTNEKTLVKDLEPKPCFTCARQITPRANWSSIRYCSDRCKSWKSIVKIGKAEDYSKEVTGKIETTSSPSLLEKSLSIRESSIVLALDAWIEATILYIAKESPSPAPLQRVSELMHIDLQRDQAPSYYTTIKEEALKQNPGEREMIRRAARRLVVLPPASWPFTAQYGSTDQRITLTQLPGKRVLTTLQDVSFAKGEMYVQ
jgi:hypothetical protein